RRRRGGAGSLRAACPAANRAAGTDRIAFAPGVRGTIALTSGELSITDHLTIDGPGALRLTVSGSDASRVFSIAAGKVVAIEGLTVTRGRATEGAGILNNGGTLQPPGPAFH